MEQNSSLSLLGLALRGGNLAVGEEPVEAAARARDARVLLLAADASENTRRRVEHFAETGQCLWLQVPFTKAELGRALGRKTLAVAAVTDIGLAHALVKKLALADPERYGEAARRLELKARRAAERRMERQERKKNLQTGKRRRISPGRGAETAGEAGQRAPVAKPGWPPSRKAPSGTPPRGKHGGAGPGPYRRSRPVKKGKGSFRKREDGRSR